MFRDIIDSIVNDSESLPEAVEDCGAAARPLMISGAASKELRGSRREPSGARFMDTMIFQGFRYLALGGSWRLPEAPEVIRECLHTIQYRLRMGHNVATNILEHLGSRRGVLRAPR